MCFVTSPRPSTAEESDWRSLLKSAVRTPAELCRILRLPPHFATAALRADRDFSLFAPHPYIARMEPGNPQDPLLRQVLPLEDELQDSPHFISDPVGDAAARRAPALLQKYHGRALMIATGACAVHCRYCFRRHYPFDERADSRLGWEPAIEEIARDPSLEEVILSGGDPLTTVDSLLADLAAKLDAIPHLRRLRIHTRLPIMIPQRVTDELLRWLGAMRLQPVFVIHANHPQELDNAVAGALARIADAGIPLLNQSVLLRGINDDLESLVGLSRRLLECRVMPYYLHQLDRVAGAAHFEVPVPEGMALVREMRTRLPGYAVPRYVREDAGVSSKTVLA